MKRVCQGFGYRQYGKKSIEVIYKETPDGWLEIDTEKEFDPEEKTNQNGSKQNNVFSF